MAGRKANYCSHITMSSSVDKYDRQIRLWGAHGQRALSQSHICLLNAGPTGTETLKNLVLPGVGKISIVDSAMVTEYDLANNFFVNRENLGQPRAKVTLDLLLEMNDEVSAGEAILENPDSLVESQEFFSQFSLVVATQLVEASLCKLSATLWSAQVPLIAVRNMGFIGHIRVQKEEHRIVDAKAKINSKPDLCIARPFPRLRTIVDATPLESLHLYTHSHVPFLILLIKAIDKWRTSHEPGAIPTRSSEDRKAIKAELNLLRLPALDEDKVTVLPGFPEVHSDEQNFDEANNELNTYLGQSVPASVLSVLEDPKAKILTSESPDFWVIAFALREFVEANGRLPLSGSIPDMHSDTESYTALQNAFYEKSAEDCAAVFDRVKQLRLEYPSAVVSGISIEDLTQQMCKNAQQIRVIRYSKIADELRGPLDSETVEMIQEALNETPDEVPEDLSMSDQNPNADIIAKQKPMIWYLMLRAFDRFTVVHGRNPGCLVSGDAALASDAAELLRVVGDIFQELGLGQVPFQLISASHAKEIVRSGGGEMHTMAAIMGGVAAQEAVKILTGLFIPLDNTFICNGISGNSAAFRIKGAEPDIEMSPSQTH